MKKSIRIISLLLALVVSFSVLVSCSDNDDSGAGTDKNLSYIKISGTDLEKDYIGYFFYVAQLNMISEAGMVLGDGGNSTQNDVEEFWKTTEIEGRKAVEVARDLAADNAVIQTVQYLKAKSEGIVISETEEKEIEIQINNAQSSSGGKDAFQKRLSEMGCSIDAYKQILTENIFVNKLYQKYDSEGKLDISDAELDAFAQNNAGAVLPENMLDSAKKDKFNAMSQDWKKEFDIVINDEAMKEFNIKDKNGKNI